MLLRRRVVRAKAAEAEAGVNAGAEAGVNAGAPDAADGTDAGVTVLAGVAPRHPPAPSAVLDEAELEAAAYLDLVRRHVST